jgi:hypothetical protein
MFTDKVLRPAYENHVNRTQSGELGMAAYNAERDKRLAEKRATRGNMTWKEAGENISRFPRAFSAANNMRESVANAPTAGLKTHAAVKGAVQGVAGLAGDLVSKGKPVANFVSEAVTGQPAQATPQTQQAQPAAAPQPAVQQPAPATNTQPAPQTPAASLRAQINQPQPRTEQQLLDEISGQPGGLRRMADIGRGNVFRFDDPSAMRPARAPVDMKANADPNERRHPMTGELMGGSASQMRREGGRFNHLPISGVTYSDSIGGTGLKADGQAAQDLQALYNRDAQQRSTVAQKAGLDAAMYPVSGPMVGAADRGQQIQLQRDLQQQQPQRQAMGLKALELQGEIAKAKAGRADADPKKDPWKAALDTQYPENDDDPQNIRRAQAQALISKIAAPLQMRGITLDPNQLAAYSALALNGATDKNGVLDELKALDLLSERIGLNMVPLRSTQ